MWGVFTRLEANRSSLVLKVLWKELSVSAALLPAAWKLLRRRFGSAERRNPDMLSNSS
jgi:hypothetical protein